MRHRSARPQSSRHREANRSTSCSAGTRHSRRAPRRGRRWRSAGAMRHRGPLRRRTAPGPATTARNETASRVDPTGASRRWPEGALRPPPSRRCGPCRENRPIGAQPASGSPTGRGEPPHPRTRTVHRSSSRSPTTPKAARHGSARRRSGPRSSIAGALGAGVSDAQTPSSIHPWERHHRGW